MDNKNYFPTWEEAQEKLASVITDNVWDIGWDAEKRMNELFNALPMPPTDIITRGDYIHFVYLTVDQRHRLALEISTSNGSIAAVLSKTTKTGVDMNGRDCRPDGITIERAVELVNAFINGHMRGENAIPPKGHDDAVDKLIVEIQRNQPDGYTRTLFEECLQNWSNKGQTMDQTIRYALKDCSLRPHALQVVDNCIMLYLPQGHTLKLYSDGALLLINENTGEQSVYYGNYNLMYKKIDKARDQLLKDQKEAWLAKQPKNKSWRQKYLDWLEEIKAYKGVNGAPLFKSEAIKKIRELILLLPKEPTQCDFHAFARSLHIATHDGRWIEFVFDRGHYLVQASAEEIRVCQNASEILDALYTYQSAPLGGA